MICDFKVNILMIFLSCLIAGLRNLLDIYEDCYEKKTQVFHAC